MKITLPREIKGIAYDAVNPFDMNDALLDTMLPTLFYRVVAQGREVLKIAANPSHINQSIDHLAQNHDRVVGFAEAANRRTLDRLVRSSLVTIGYKGVSRRESDKQLDGIIPYSLASFRVGFPKSRTRNRKIDQFVYQALVTQFRGDKQEVLNLFREIFGEGVDVTVAPDVAATRKTGSDMDLLTDLSIAYLDYFPAVKISNKSIMDRKIATPLPEVQRAIGRDLYRYLIAYGKVLPASVMTRQLTALVGFELYIYTVKLMAAIPALVADPTTLPPAMQTSGSDGSPPELYVDFTGLAGGPNRRMADGSLRRDIEAVQPFMEAVYRLRYLDRLLDTRRTNPRLAPIIEAEIGARDADRNPEYLQGLLHLLNNPSLSDRLNDAAADDLDQIRRENPITKGTSDDDAADEGNASGSSAVDALLIDGAPEFEQVVHLLMVAQEKQAQQNILRWMSSIGGLGQSYGLIVGTRTSRQSWRYAPSNDLLAILVQLAAIDHPKWNRTTRKAPEPIALQEFLEWLEVRFGLLVDRPPAGLGFDSPDYTAAARDNLGAMLRRLRQMGIFEDLSDDFSVQRLTPPFAHQPDMATVAGEATQGAAS